MRGGANAFGQAVAKSSRAYALRTSSANFRTFSKAEVNSGFSP